MEDDEVPHGHMTGILQGKVTTAWPKVYGCCSLCSLIKAGCGLLKLGVVY